MKRIPVIDIFRGLSILLTLAIHLGPNYITKPYSSEILNDLWFKIWSAGGYGVPMFFVISGYLITRIVGESPGGLYQPNIREFYSRRIGRIIPLLFLICVIGALIIHFIPTEEYATKRVTDCFYNPSRPITDVMWFSIATFSFNWYKAWLGSAHAYFGQHWDSLWSLSVEEQFYFCYPLILKWLASQKKLVIFLCAVVFIGPAFNTINYCCHLKINFSLGSYGLIALGCLLYIVQKKISVYLKPKDCWFLCAHGFILMVIVAFHSHAFVYVWLGIWGEAMIGFGLFLFLLGGMNLSFFNSKWWLPLTWPGNLSYGAYLLHIVILFFLWDLFSKLDSFSAFLIFSLVTMVLAQISYSYFELPANKRIRKWLNP